MKHILIIVNHYPLSPRLHKLIKSLNKLYPNYKLKIVAWNRNNIKKISDNIEVELHNSKSGYGNKLKKILGMITFRRKIEQVIKLYKPDIIQCIDWDTLMILSTLNYGTAEILYEVYDIPESDNKVVQKIINKIESKIILKVNKLIYASPYFGNRYRHLKIPEYTLNNKPSISILNESKIDNLNNNLNETFKVAYIGNIRYFDILKNLVDASKISDINLEFHGDGPSLKLIKSYCDKKGYNIKFTGRYNYDDIPSLYNSCDIVWAVYPSKHENVKLAISNKHFESIIFGKPCIYSKDTFIGEYVENNKLGFTVDPYSIEDIAKLFKVLKENKDKIMEVKLSMINMKENSFWESEEDIIKEIYK